MRIFDLDQSKKLYNGNKFNNNNINCHSVPKMRKLLQADTLQISFKGVHEELLFSKDIGKVA